MSGSECRLIADIGGTNVRFALVRELGEPKAVRRLPLNAFADFETALAAYSAAEAIDERRFTGMAIAAAGPVRAGKVAMTNADWYLDQSELSARFGGIPVRILNDLAAVAYALPGLKESDAQAVSRREAPAEPLPLLALNVGTGLGAAVAIPHDTGWTVLPTEAGHMRFAATNQAEMALLDQIETVEDLIAGPGWQRFNAANTASAKGIARYQDHANLFAAVLGRFAGDMVLATGAWGGVYFCGGVLDSWQDLVLEDILLSSFRRHGQMSSLLEQVPVWRIVLQDPALKGLAAVKL